MSVFKGFFEWLGALRDSALGKVIVGLIVAIIGLILLISNPNGTISNEILQIIDDYDLVWLIILIVGLIILIVGIYELLTEANIKIGRL